MVESNKLSQQQQTPLKVMICSGENDELGHQLAEELVQRGARVTLLVHPNHTSSNYVKHLTEVVGCQFVIGGAMEDEPLQLVKKLHGQHVIISASLRNSLLHPFVQYKTDMNLLKTCHLYALQPNSDFRAFIPCQYTFDFTKFSTTGSTARQEEIEWNWMECKKAFLQLLRADNGGVPFMSFFTGFPMDFLVEFLVDSTQNQIKCYGDDENNLKNMEILCTSIKDICKLAVEKILQINPLSTFTTQEYTFFGECNTLQEISRALNYKILKLGSLDECNRRVSMLKEKIIQNEHHHCEKEKFELAGLLIMQFLAESFKNSSSNTTFQKQTSVPMNSSDIGFEKEYKFDSLGNFVKQQFSESKSSTTNQ